MWISVGFHVRFSPYWLTTVNIVKMVITLITKAEEIMKHLYRGYIIKHYGIIAHKLPQLTIVALSILIPEMMFSDVFAQTTFEGKLKSVAITDSLDTNNAPLARFTYTSIGKSFTFNGAASADSDGDILGFKWDFGDDNTATGVSTTHTYSVQGEYPVTLTVTDNNNAVAITQLHINSAECETVPFIDVDTQDGSVQMISNDFYSYAGGQYSGPPVQLCKAAFRMSAWLGNISSKVYEARVYTASGTTLNQIKAGGISTSIAGSTLVNSTNVYYEFVFEQPVTITSGDILVVTEKTGNQVVDASNFIRLYRSSTTNTDLNFGTWKSNGDKSALYDNISPAVKLYKLSQ